MREWLANEANGGAARPWPERLRVISEIAHWLVYMHTHGGGIWHMDVKKGNFFLSSTLMSASQPRSGANRLRRCRLGPWLGRCFTWRPSASRRTGETLKDVMLRITGAVDVYALGLVLRQVIHRNWVPVAHRTAPFETEGLDAGQRVVAALAERMCKNEPAVRPTMIAVAFSLSTSQHEKQQVAEKLLELDNLRMAASDEIRRAAEETRRLENERSLLEGQVQELQAAEEERLQAIAAQLEAHNARVAEIEARQRDIDQERARIAEQVNQVSSRREELREEEERVRSTQSTLQELAECAVCYDGFTDPRLLPCSHTFCLGCLAGIIASNPECPLCRVRIPDGEADSFPANLLARQMVETIRLAMLPANAP